MTKFKQAVNIETQHGDAGSWFYVIKTIKEVYRQDAIGDDFDQEIIEHLDALLNLFGSETLS